MLFGISEVIMGASGGFRGFHGKLEGVSEGLSEVSLVVRAISKGCRGISGVFQPLGVSMSLRGVSRTSGVFRDI